MSAQIPVDIHEISVDWLNAALKNSLLKDNEISGVHSEEIGAGVGLVGGLHRCHLAYATDNDALPTSVIIKLRSNDPATLEVARMFKLYEKEVAFYRDLADSTPIDVPSVFYSDFNPKTHDFVLILEDLNYLDTRSQIAGATEEQAELAIQNVAQLHARFLGRDKEHPLKGYYSLVAPSFTLKIHVGFRNSVKKVLDVFGSELNDSAKMLIRNLGDNLAGCYYEMAKGPRTLTHSDYRLDNMFFGDLEQGDMRVIDWQTNGIGYGMIDVVYFMCGSVDSEIRARIERRLLEKYHAITCDQGGADWNFEDCWRDYRRGFIPAMTVPVIAAGELSYEDENAYELMKTGLQRMNTALNDLDVEEFAIERPPRFSMAGFQSAIGNRLAARVAKKSNSSS